VCVTDQGIIRKATVQDLGTIVELEKKCFGSNSSYSRRQLYYLLTKANSICLVEEKHHTIRGFVILLLKKGNSVAGFETLNVDPKFRGKGIALNLLKSAEEDCKKRGHVRKLRLEVSTGNRHAIMLYAKAGFRKTEDLKQYYSFPQGGSRDAYRMIKEIA